MWIVIYLMKGFEAVLKLKEKLENAGILAMIRRKTEGEGTEDSFYEILVPQTEVEQAQELIICR